MCSGVCSLRLLFRFSFLPSFYSADNNDDVSLCGHSSIWSIKCQKAVKNPHHSFPEGKMMFLNGLFCPTDCKTPKDIQFTTTDG